MSDWQVISSGHFHSDECFGETTKREWRELTFWVEEQFNQYTGALWDSITGEISCYGDSLSESFIEHYKALSYKSIELYRDSILLKSYDCEDWEWCLCGIDFDKNTLYGIPIKIPDLLNGELVGNKNDILSDLIKYRGWHEREDFLCCERDSRIDECILGSTLDERVFFMYRKEGNVYLQMLE